MKTLILIHGYARSGKTTLLNQLQKQGHSIVSTSQELDFITCKRFILPRYCIEYLRNKDNEKLNKVYGVPVNCRNLKIDTAENWYIPKFGRASLIEKAFLNQLDPHNCSDLVFFETIGGEEAELAKEYWQEHFNQSTLSLNIRRSTEVKGCDIRELAPKNNFQNIFNCPEIAVNQLLSYVQQLINLETLEPTWS